VIALVKSEWIKLRTVTMNWVLTIIALAFPSAITLLTAFFRGDDPQPLQTRQLLDLVLNTSFLPLLLITVVAATSITSEFGFGTIRPTFTATPRRSHVVLAKAIVAVLYAFVVQTVVMLVACFGGAAVANGRGSDVRIGEVPTATAALVGLVVLGMIMALVGLGVGMLVRSTPASVVLLILWPLMAEALVGGLLGLFVKSVRVIEWMPFRAGFQLSSLDVFDGPSRVVGGVYFGAVAVALCALGTWSMQRRDA
jgi:ABC-2 type transport system permease protein